MTYIITCQWCREKFKGSAIDLNDPCCVHCWNSHHFPSHHIKVMG